MNILFLDIDGPRIPTSMFLFDRDASFKRIFSPIAIKCVNYLCEKSNTKIVTNTTHNVEFTRDNDDCKDCGWDTRTIKDSLINAGINAEYFHVDSKTEYPSYRRHAAVIKWLDSHSDIDNYVAFDDDVFTTDDYLCYIDPDAGVNLKHIHYALNRFDIGAPIIFM